MTIAIDQSTSATKAMLFNDNCELLARVNIAHKQFYPKNAWVEHCPNEIYENTVKAIKLLFENQQTDNQSFSLAITNQRETVVVWNRLTGKPVYNAIVWQDLRGTEICNNLKMKGFDSLVKEKSGLLLDPYFSASGVKWILDNVENARQEAENGDLLMGTIDSWLIWKLTGGKTHATDYTNASRTLLFNIHTLTWDDDLLQLFDIPRSMLPNALPCDCIFGSTNVENFFAHPILIAGVIGDSHGALVGQVCLEQGMGKATYGTGSSVMVNIGENAASAPSGLVTSVGFAALDKVFYAFEGNIHCTGATIKWLAENMKLIESPQMAETLACEVENNDGVYLVPAFAGLGAPHWQAAAKAIITGLTLNSRREHIVRAALESIAYQVKDLVDLMTCQANIRLRELRVDGGPTRNNFLMQFQADVLQSDICRSQIEEASALGAVIMNGFALERWKSFEDVQKLSKNNERIIPKMQAIEVEKLYTGWKKAVEQCK
jgi:glycerol kinase